MNHIKQAVAILGIMSILNGIPVAVYAQAQLSPLRKMNFQESYSCAKA